MLASIPGITSAKTDAAATPDLPAACASSTKESLRREVYGLTKKQAGSAWKLVQTFLCADKNTARRAFEKAHTASIIFRIAAPTGVEEKSVNDISNELQQQLPAGKAWGPSVRKEEEDLVIYYSINDTCWDFFGLRFVDRKWQLVTLGGGCD
jgi:hypothetical protein